MKSNGCLPFIKKNPEILAGNSRSVRTICVVYNLPKISVLSPSARLDASYNMKLVRTQETCKWRTNFHSERSNQENGTTFSYFPFVPGIFQWDDPKKTLLFTSQPEFPGICGKR